MRSVSSGPPAPAGAAGAAATFTGAGSTGAGGGGAAGAASTVTGGAGAGIGAAATEGAAGAGAAAGVAAPGSATAGADAPRPVSTSRTWAAVGRASGRGFRQAYRIADTASLLAGAGIAPPSTGGVALYESTFFAYSPWSSDQYGCCPASSWYSISPQVNTSDAAPG